MQRVALPLFLSLVLLPACATRGVSSHLKNMYSELHEQVADRRPGEAADSDWAVDQRARVVAVRGYIEREELKTAEDYFHAAVILVETDTEEDLVHALGLGLHAAKLGLDTGFRVAAEATDKICVKKGNPQRYGTQFVYEPVLRAWRLYPYDPMTSDAERKAMGVEPLAKLREREAELNKQLGGKPK